MKMPWLDFLIGFIRKINIQVSISSLWFPSKQQINDVSIMGVLENEIEQQVLAEINACPLFLQVEMVSDVNTIDVINISSSAMERCHPFVVQNEGDWPHQPRPKSASWRKWRKTLQIIATYSRLKQPLGNWTDKRQDNWKFFRGNNGILLNCKQ